jgi:ectoine hydroxylase
MDEPTSHSKPRTETRRDPSASPPTRDLYPSRVGGQADMLERKDPVVHAVHAAAGACPTPLDVRQLEAFERDGYVFLEAWLPQERIDRCMHELRLRLQALAHVSSPALVREPESEEIRSLFAIHETEGEVARLLRDPHVVSAAMQILGSPVYVHQSRVNLKPGFDGKEFYWHSDFETWHVEDGMPRMRALSASILLTDNHPFNGPLMVVPGSHRFFVSCAGRTPPRNFERSLRKQLYGVPDRDQLAWLVQQGGIVAPTGPAGSVLLFDCNLMHGSNGNITPYPRSNAFCVYNSVENALVEPFGGMPRRPEHIASRRFEALPSA